MCKCPLRSCRYSRAQGIFAGLDLSGGVLGPDTEANHDVYGPTATARLLLTGGHVTAPPEVRPFMTTMEREFVVATSGRK